MQSPESLLRSRIVNAVEALFGVKIEAASVNFSKTNPQFEGDITITVFPFVKMAGKGPEQTAQLIGEYLQHNVMEVDRFNVVKGFLNIVLSNSFWVTAFNELSKDDSFGTKKVTPDAGLVMVEYSSPNTNKPLHLGHMRNILLGYSVAEILKANGNKVMKVNLVNDRGIHICKSMLAWQIDGKKETPESSGLKGDHLVGKFYVLYNFLESSDKQKVFNLKNRLSVLASLSTKDLWTPENIIENPAKILEEINNVRESESDYFSTNDVKILDELESLIKEATYYRVKIMLQKWEAGDKEVKELWEMMNGWVYDGFAITYKKLGVDFDKTYYESQTYLLGKSIVEAGLKKGVLQKREDGAVVIDNTDAGLDVKVLLRSDGTSVYMTQDLGTAEERHNEFPFNKHIYVVGNEQEYHFKTLKVCLKKLGHDWADGLYHLSYGMVELPEGKMKSREGTVVDADDLIDVMEKDALALAEEKGLIEGMAPEEKAQLSHMVGMSALKYFILKVDPKRKMLFDPKESIDLHGNTGPFIQYTHARIRSIWKKSGLNALPVIDLAIVMHVKEKELIKTLSNYPAVINDAANGLSPALLANYTYELAKTFNQFYDACPVLKEENESLKNFRLVLCVSVARTIKSAMKLLGIEVPERM